MYRQCLPVVVVALLPACATALYEGPRRPDHELATIGGAGTKIARIDRNDLDGGTFDVLPGFHLVAAYLRNGRAFSTLPLAVCFEAEAGRTYFARGELVVGGRWKLTINDPGTGEPIASRAVESWSQDCSQASQPEPPLVFRPKRLSLTAPRLLDSPVAGSDQGVPPNGETPSSGETPAAEGAAAPEASPSAALSANAAVAPPRGARPMHRPGTGGGLEFGGSFGGDEIAVAELSNGDRESLYAGGGGMMSLLGSWTPIWLGNVVGIGMAGTIGFKVSEIGGSNGALKLLRFPASLSLQTLLPLGGRLYFLARAGVLKELGLSLTGTGIAEPLGLPMSAPLGPQYEGGLFFEAISQAALGFSVRYASLRYEGEFSRIDASHVTLLGGFYFFM